MKRSKCPYCKERVAMRLEMQEWKHMKSTTFLYTKTTTLLKICSKCGWIVKEIKL
jgi:DNA-directed RNA polymerase subunit RPC12/RpoP